MRINSDQLAAFYTIAKCLNFTKAAEKLHVTQSALSQRIAKLEEILQTSLFVRDRTSIRLTDAGEIVLRFCHFVDIAESELLSKLEGTKEDLAGVLRIGGFSSINRSLVIPSLKKLMQKNPKLSVQLITKEIYELDQLLRSTEVDYIFTNQRSESSSIESIFLGYEENVLVQLKKGAENKIFLDHDERDQTTKHYFLQNKIPFNPLTVRYLDDVYGLIDGVKCGYGKAVLPVHLIENESMLEIVDATKSLKVPIFLQFYRQVFYRNVHNQFIEIVEHYFKERLLQK